MPNLGVRTKVAFGETGRIMLGGESESSKMIYKSVSEFIPEPVGFGKFKVPNPATHLYLSAFVAMDATRAPDPAKFTHRLAHLHMNSLSPTSKFGFRVQTCDGDRAHAVNWQ